MKERRPSDDEQAATAMLVFCIIVAYMVGLSIGYTAGRGGL